MTTYKNIVDIIVWTVEQLQNKCSFDKMTFEKLKEKGFTDTEISVAFSWMVEQLEEDKGATTELVLSLLCPAQSFRIFSSEEKNMFHADAYKSILRLLAVGVIRPYHVDMIIDKADMLGLKKISSEMVRQFVAYYMFNAPSPADSTNDRYSLCGDESVN